MFRFYSLREFLLYLLVKFLSCGKNSHKTGPRKKILLVRLDGIGDCILWLDSASKFRDIYPEKEFEITLLGNDLWEPLTEDMPFFDQVWPLSRKRLDKFFYKLSTFWKIKKAGFDIAIQPTYSREFLTDAFIKMSCAPVRIGSQGDPANIKFWQKKLTDKWYTVLVPASAKPLMELERNAEFMRGLGLKNVRAGLYQFRPHLKPAATQNENFYILFPGASWTGKMWPASRFLEIARRLHDAKKWEGIICGGSTETELAEKIMKASDVPMKNLAGKTSLHDLINLINRAQMIITNDTAAVHIAAACETPAVCILGGGHFGRYMPYKLEQSTYKIIPVGIFPRMDCFNCNWHCIYKIPDGEPKPCISSISVDEVWIKIEELLNKHTLWSAQDK
ncbi:MAG: glycosyltransferase family 9 protein [Actinomycetota bacterium]|nr:glycosyltransferase family 9 protein [Actinomycetota bacterium]